MQSLLLRSSVHAQCSPIPAHISAEGRKRFTPLNCRHQQRRPQLAGIPLAMGVKDPLQVMYDFVGGHLMVVQGLCTALTKQSAWW